MIFTPGQYVVNQNVLSVVIVQCNFSKKLDVSSATMLESLSGICKDLGFPKYLPAEHRSVNYSDSGMETRSTTIHRYLNDSITKGVSISSETAVYFTNEHTDFDDTLNVFISFLERAAEVADKHFEGLGIRYVNVIPPSISLNPLSESISGFAATGILGPFAEKHSHAHTQFWCETDNGRLYVRTSLKHGTTMPQDLGHADIVFDKQRLISFNDMVYHLDIYETNNFSEELKLNELSTVFGDIRLRIAQAFLDALSAQGIADLQIEPKAS